MIHLHGMSRIGKPTETESKLVIDWVQVGEWGHGGWQLKGFF